MNALDPHFGQPILHSGRELEESRVAVIMLHGRGADARDILSLAESTGISDVAWMAPEAADRAWYPFRFTEPVEKNEPWLSSSLLFVSRLVSKANQAGIPSSRIVIAGFSQGACLTLEFASRNATRYGGVVAFAGGLIGPDDTKRNDTVDFDNTPVFIGLGDRDIHIPVTAAENSARHFLARGAKVDFRVYPGLPHTVTMDQVEALSKIIIAASAQ